MTENILCRISCATVSEFQDGRETSCSSASSVMMIVRYYVYMTCYRASSACYWVLCRTRDGFVQKWFVQLVQEFDNPDGLVSAWHFVV